MVERVEVLTEFVAVGTEEGDSVVGAVLYGRVSVWR